MHNEDFRIYLENCRLKPLSDASIRSVISRCNRIESIFKIDLDNHVNNKLYYEKLIKDLNYLNLKKEVISNMKNALKNYNNYIKNRYFDYL